MYAKPMSEGEKLYGGEERMRAAVALRTLNHIKLEPYWKPHQQVFCLPTYLRRLLRSVGQGSLVMQDHREVSPLAREGILSVGGLTFYPFHY